MLWVGEVEDAESIEELITSATTTGDPVLDFENLDINIASGLKKMLLAGNCKKQVTTAEGKAQSEKISLTVREIAWMIYDFINIRGDNETILDCGNVKIKNATTERQCSSDTKWDEVLSSVTDRPTDKMLEGLHMMQVEMSEELEDLLQVNAPETTFGDKKYDYCRLE